MTELLKLRPCAQYIFQYAWYSEPMTSALIYRILWEVLNTFRLPGSCHSFYEQVSLDAILEWGQSLPQRLSVKRVHSVKSSQNSLNDAIIQPSSTELRNVVVLSCSCQSGVWLAQSTQPFLYLRATRHMQTVI